jgi:putative ABC transport system ATP-binding protein
MITMTHLSRVYRTEAIETYALRDVSLNVRQGEFVAITGPSGSGKTTLLSIAGLLEELTDGQYQLDGVDVRHLSDRQRSRLRNEKLGFIFQHFNLIHQLSVRENVEVPLRYRGMPARVRRERTTSALERVGLAARQLHYPAQLSGGQQQRVAIARALAGSPRVLLADEPTGNLDSHTARGVMQLLEELHQDGATILMVTHDPGVAMRAHREVHIVDGEIVDEDPDSRLADSIAAIPLPRRL